MTLSRLCLRDYLFVEALTAEFASGFCVLTGETGAGKSLLVGALGLLAGGRAGGKIRPQAKRAEVEAQFNIAANAGAQEWLAANALENDDEETLLLRRVVSAGGKSSAFINGRQATLAQLAEAAELVLDICGQHAHYSLRSPAAQRALLDAAGQTPAAAVAAAHGAWRRAEAKWQEARAAQAQQAARREFLQEAVGELQALGFSAEKWRTQNENLTRAANAADLAQGCAQTLALLEEDKTSATAQLAAAKKILAAMRQKDATLAEAASIVDDAANLANDAARAVAAYADKLQAEPEALAQAEAFVSECHRLTRKYKAQDAARLGEVLEEFKQELAGGGNEKTRELKEAARAARQKLEAAAKQLSAARAAAAKRFAAAVNAALPKLAMRKAKFEAQLRPLEEISAAGAEAVAFLLSGQNNLPAANIGEVASGGELSRLGLAIHLAAGAANQNAVAVFDEVDAGVGGATASAIGGLLRELSQTRQVLCVTHLPQVAACANAHWRVEGSPLALARLQGDSRVLEVARMGGGKTITAAAKRHAEELLAAGAA